MTRNRPTSAIALLTMLLCLVAAHRSAAQSSSSPRTSPGGSASGRVYFVEEVDDKGNPKKTSPAGDVLVKAINEKGIKTQRRTSDDGEFSIPVTYTGNHVITAKAPPGFTLMRSRSVWIDDIQNLFEVAPPVYLKNSTSSMKRDPIVLFLYPVAWSQDPAGKRDQKPETGAGQRSFSGRIQDRQKHAISGALVSVVVAKGESDQLKTLTQTRTDKTGVYRLDLTGLDSYDDFLLSISKLGFNKLVLSLDKNERVPPILVLDDSSFDDAALLEKTNVRRRGVYSSRLLETLPVAGSRNFDSFALLAPGVAPPPETPNARGPGVSPGLGTAGQFSVNGLLPRENNFTVDGSDNNDEDIGARRQGFVMFAPQSIESLNEYQIVTALADARFGRNIGGHVNALTKSGSPELHGSIYGFLTDNRLNAREFFDRVSAPRPFSLTRQKDGAAVTLDGLPITFSDRANGRNLFTRSQLGVNVGGPLRFLDSFFFGSFEHLVTRANRESHFIVPTLEQRGAFDAGASGLLVAIAVPVPNIPTYAASVPGDAIFSLYPFPNDPLGPFGRNTYTASLPADSNGTRLSAKLDHQFGSPDPTKPRHPWNFRLGHGDVLTGRYNFSQETSVVPVTDEALFSSLRPHVRTQNIAFYLNRQLTKRLSDVVRASFGRTRLSFGEVRDAFLSPSSLFPDVPFLLNAPLLLNVTAPLADGTLTPPSFISAASPAGTALLGQLGYAGIRQSEQITGALGQVTIPGFSSIGTDVYHFPQSRANNTIQVADTFTFMDPGGKRIYTAGTDVRKVQINSTLERNFRPLARFGGLHTDKLTGQSINLPGGPPLAPREYSGLTLAAAGVPTGLFETLADNPDSSIRIRFVQVGFFQLTDWRIRPNLNLNFGSHVNYLTRLHTKEGRLERAFDLSDLARQSQQAVDSCVAQGGARAKCQAVATAIISAFPSDFAGAFGGDKFDLDVRGGFAWSVNERTVIRAGLANYSGEFPGIVLGESRNAFPNFLPLNVADAPFNNGADRYFIFNLASSTLRALEPGLLLPNSLNTLMPDVTAISLLTNRVVKGGQTINSRTLGLDLVLPQQRLKTPYSIQAAVTIERRIGKNGVLSVAYVGTRGMELLRISTPGLGPDRSGLLNNSGLKFIPLAGTRVPFFANGVTPPQTVIPDALIAIARTFYESSASSSYHSLQVEFRKQYAQHFQIGTAFTYSHSIDDVSDFFDTAGAFALPQDSLVRSERASSNFDVRVRSVTSFVRDFSRDWFFSKSQRLGGWQFSGIVTAQTGQPFTVNSAFDINRDGNLTDRLNTTVGIMKGSATGDRSVQLSLAPGTKTSDLLAADGKDGAVGRNTFRAPGQVTFDLAVTKFFNFNDKFKLQARTEIFNLFNRTNFGIPVRILESPAFGKSTYTTTPPRTIQFAVKLGF